MQKEILVNIARLLGSKLIPALVMTLINVIYSRVLTQSDYGSYQTVWTYLYIFIILAAFGVPKYIITFGYKLGSENYKKLLKIFLIVLLLVVLVVSFYLFVFSNHFDVLSRLYFLVLLLSQTIYLVQEAYVISKNEGKRLIWSNGLYALLLFAVHIYLVYWLEYSLRSCILGIAIVSLIRNVLIWVYSTRKIYEKSNEASETVADFSLLFWVGFNDSLQILTKWLDKLILLFVLSASEFAIYYNGTFELPLIGMFLLSFQTIITLYGSKQAGSIEHKLSLFRSSSFFMSGIIFPLFAWMFWYATPIVGFLFGGRYEESGVLFALTSLYLPVRICSYTVLLQIENKGKNILIGSIIDFFMSIALMLILYPFLKLNGLILALVISTYVQAAYYLVKIKGIYKVPLNHILPIKGLILRLIFSVAIIGGVKILAFELSPLNNLIIGTLSGFLLFIFYLRKSIILTNWKNIIGKNIS